MRLATLENHDPSCTGCPACSEQMARVLRMNLDEHSQWLKKRTAPRTLVMRQTGGAGCKCGEHRATVPPPPDMAARIRAAAQPSPLKDLMLAGISYDHM